MFPSIVKKQQQKKKNLSQITAASQYSMTFPFTDLDVEQQRLKTYNFECALYCREISSQPCVYMDELLNVFTMLENSRNLSLKRLSFVDCLSNAGTGCFLALSSRFGKVLGIELSDETKETAERYLEDLRENFSENCAACDISFKVGSFLDYTPLDSDILFLDGSLLIDHVGILDEAAVVRSLFELSKRLLKSATIIIVTLFVSLDQAHLEELGYSHLSCIYQRHKLHAKDYNIWMIQSAISI